MVAEPGRAGPLRYVLPTSVMVRDVLLSEPSGHPAFSSGFGTRVHTCRLAAVLIGSSKFLVKR